MGIKKNKEKTIPKLGGMENGKRAVKKKEKKIFLPRIGLKDNRLFGGLQDSLSRVAYKV